MSRHAARLRETLASGGLLRAPGVYDALGALLVEQAGFPLAFVSGAGVSFSRLAQPDLGLMGLSELADTVAAMRDRLALPLLVDMDTGFGNALNVQRAVRLLERSGASALQMEDQVFPKRCGHMRGKQLIPCDEMLGKLRAAIDARDSADTLIVARTDALGVNGFDDAVDRAERYLETGVDALFIEAPATVEQMKEISRQFGTRIPLVHNLVEGGNSPVRSGADLESLGYRIALFPLALMHSFVPQARTVLAHLAEHGDLSKLGGPLADLHELNQLLDAEGLLKQSDDYG